jgi:hypothetical protein
MAYIDDNTIHFIIGRGYIYPTHDSTDLLVNRDSVPFFFEKLHQCRISLLGNGELAVVPRAAQCGDVICILSGTVSTCALRSSPDNSWSLVGGDCDLFTQRFERPDTGEWFVSDDFILENQDKVQEFSIR